MVLLIVCGITSAELESSHTNGPDDNTYPSSIPGRLSVGWLDTLQAFISFPARDYQNDWFGAVQNEEMH